MPPGQAFAYSALPSADPEELVAVAKNRDEPEAGLGAARSALRQISKEESFLRRDSKGGPTPTYLQRWQQGEFTISPDGNIFIDFWDVVVISALIATAFLLPFEVALITKAPHELAVLDHSIDLIFTIDIVLAFNVAFESSGTTDQYERSPIKIARRYMAVPFSDDLKAGWFWPDVVTVIPWETVTGKTGGSQLKLVRVLRLVRMLRLVRVLKLFKRLHTKVGFSFALVKIASCMAVSLLLVHWLACGWAHLGLYGHEYLDSDVNWLTTTRLATQREMADITIMEAYTVALYLCFVVLTTVGFGDVFPVNNVEIILMTVTIFLTGLTWAWVVANVVDVINNMDVYNSQFKQVMDDLNRLMKDKDVHPEMQIRVRKHLHESYNVHRHKHHQSVVRWLSDGLQGELATAGGVDRICSKIWYFRNVAHTNWMIDIAQHFEAELFSPDERITHLEAVSVLIKGSAARKGRVIIRDAVIGDDMILMTEILKERSMARTLTVCEIMTLQREKLLLVCEKHEDLNLRIRRAQIKLAIWRAFIYVAQRLKKKPSINEHGWDTLMSSEKPNSARTQRCVGNCLTADDVILRAFHVHKRDGWAESGGSHNATVQLVARKVVEKDTAKGSAILKQLQDLREQVTRQQQLTSGHLDALTKRIDSVDRRTQTLEQEPSRQAQAVPSQPAVVESPVSPTKSGKRSLFRSPIR